MKKLLLGIEIGPGYARCARVDSAGKTVEATAHAEIGEGGLPVAVRQLVVAAGTEHEAAVSMPSSGSASRFLELPPLKKSVQEAAIHSRIKRFLDFHEEEHALSYRESGLMVGGLKRKGFFVTVTSRAAAGGLPPLLHTQGLTVRRLEIPHAALLRWALHIRPELKQGTRLLFHFTSAEVLALAWCDGELFFTRHFRPAMAASAMWGRLDAFDPHEAPPLLAELAQQVRAVLNHLQYRLVDGPVEPKQVILSGLPITAAPLAEALAPRVEHDVKLLTGGMDVGPEWAVAVGLSLRALEESTWTL